MKETGHMLLLRFIKLMNVVIITALYAGVWFGFYSSRIERPFYFWGDWVVVFLFCIFFCSFGKIYDAFLISMSKVTEITYSQILSILISDGIMYVITLLLTKHLPNVLPILGTFVIQGVAALGWAVMAQWLYYKLFPAKKTAIIYDMRRGMEDLVQEYGLKKKFDIRIVTDVQHCLNNLEALNDMDVVFLSGVRSHDRNIVLKHCVKNHVRVYVVPRIGDVLMSSAKNVHMFHLPILQVSSYEPSFLFLVFKRVFDIVVSGIALVVLSPLLLITAIAIKAGDGGPVFYKQERLTKNGKRFYIHKFRSMRVDAEKESGAVLSSGENDSRITPVGKVIRKIRVDELPQLLDIFGGNLSIVGPRPERPEIAEIYEKELPEFGLRLQAKAGLTGYAQVYGKYNTTPYDKLQMDLMYIAHPSIVEDMRICFATIKVLFMSESTEGVKEGQATALSGNENKEQ